MTNKLVEEWTTDDVASWLNTIGLGHKATSFSDSSIDGAALLKACNSGTTGLMDAVAPSSLSNLQAKKILRAMEKEKQKSHISPVAAPLSEAPTRDTGDGNLEVENQALKKTLSEMKSTMSTLQAELATLKLNPSSSSGSNPTETQQHRSVNFCTKAVISGNQTHILTVTLSPGERVRAEPGSMMHMSSWINFETKTGGQGFSRMLTGQRMFLTEFIYSGPAGTADTIAFAADFPAQIVPVMVDDHGGNIICQKGSLLCSAITVDCRVEFTQSFMTGFFGGEGFILQGLRGSGYAFLVARGVVVKRTLGPGERLRVATGSLVGFEGRVKYDVEMLRGITNAFFGGEGLFVTTLTGPGVIWLESQPLDRLMAQVADRVKQSL